MKYYNNMKNKTKNTFSQSSFSLERGLASQEMKEDFYPMVDLIENHCSALWKKHHLQA